VSLPDRRIGLLFVVFALAIAGAGLKAIWVGTVRADELRDAAATQQQATLTVPARRGTIADVNGLELAVSQPAASIAATPYLIKDPAATAKKLAPLLRKPAGALLEQLARRDTGFAYLARGVPADRAGKVERLEIPGLEFIPEFRRVYPRDWMASQLLGQVGAEHRGLSGLEYALDGRLRGRAGERRLVMDALGKPIELRDRRRVRAGQDIRLTLDSRIQERAEAVLSDVGRVWRPKAATALVMDPNSGAVLAAANWPQIDANHPDAAPEYARRNGTTGATYEPGSTFKAFTVAAALDEGLIDTDTTFSLPPTLMVADREIGESHPRGWVTFTTGQILQQSSNVGAVKIGQIVGARRFDKWIRRFGFGKPTGSELPGEEAGIVLPLAKYSGSTMGNLPIGQGIAVTSMQMAAAYSAIANGGILRPPHVVAGVGGKPRPTPKGRRVISERTSAAVRRMLIGVLGPGGTASGAAIPGYDLAGKTGTAQKVDATTGEYSESRYVASFVGFAPAAKPRLLVSVMVDEPQGDIYGGAVAAPAFKEITSFALNYLRIPPE
jgi:cell division protein FtsI/penicillin-binding protein 2